MANGTGTIRLNEKFSVMYRNAEPPADPVTEEFTSVYFMLGRLGELLTEPAVEVVKFQFGERRASLMWGGTVEFP